VRRKIVGWLRLLKGQTRDHKLVPNYRAIFRQGRQAGRRDGGLIRPRPLSVMAVKAQGARGGQAAANSSADEATGKPPGAGRPAGFMKGQYDSKTCNTL
jgi:hypothetical protein